MLVSDRAARHPPVLHIRMDLLPDRNFSPSLHMLGLTRIEIPQPRHVFQIEIQAAVLTIDLERVSVLAAVGEARSFEMADGTTLVPAHKHAGILDLDLALAALRPLALPDENLARSGYRLDVTRQVTGDID